MTSGWTVIIPVKPWALSQGRLELDPDEQRDLSRALSLDILDTVTNSSAVTEFVVVSAQPELSNLARRLGGTAIIDRPLLSPDGLNTAARLARSWAVVRRPTSPTVVVPADLASLTPSVLNLTLSQLIDHSFAFVIDHVGTGTTMVSATRPGQLQFGYGDRSAQRHLSLGASPVTNVDERARLDVDDAVSLARARQLGLGRNTQVLVGALVDRHTRTSARRGSRTPP
jgi:2-phospho-L-lactate guanylyltransferase